MKDELGEKIMIELVGLKAKAYIYLIDMVGKIKKQNAQKGVSQKKLRCENYKNCLEARQLDNNINYLEKMK